MNREQYLRDREPSSRDRSRERGTTFGGWSTSPPSNQSNYRGYQGYNDTSISDYDTERDVDRNYGGDYGYRPSSYGPTQYAEGRSNREHHETFGDKVRRFFGKGPKGYKRSDDRIREDVCDRLSEGWIDASDIEISVADGEVTLSGYVDERRMKHVAEDLAERVAGVQDVHNHLRVRKTGSIDSSTQSSTMNSGSMASGSSVQPTGSSMATGPGSKENMGTAMQSQSNGKRTS